MFLVVAQKGALPFSFSLVCCPYNRVHLLRVRAGEVSGAGKIEHDLTAAEQAIWEYNASRFRSQNGNSSFPHGYLGGLHRRCHQSAAGLGRPQADHSRRMRTDCCFATQDKTWVKDQDGK
jgi:hypothetical protein